MRPLALILNILFVALSASAEISPSPTFLTGVTLPPMHLCKLVAPNDFTLPDTDTHVAQVSLTTSGAVLYSKYKLLDSGWAPFVVLTSGALRTLTPDVQALAPQTDSWSPLNLVTKSEKIKFVGNWQIERGHIVSINNFSKDYDRDPIVAFIVLLAELSKSGANLAETHIQIDSGFKIVTPSGYQPYPINVSYNDLKLVNFKRDVSVLRIVSALSRKTADREDQAIYIMQTLLVGGSISSRQATQVVRALTLPRVADELRRLRNVAWGNRLTAADYITENVMELSSDGCLRPFRH